MQIVPFAGLPDFLGDYLTIRPKLSFIIVFGTLRIEITRISYFPPASSVSQLQYQNAGVNRIQKASSGFFYFFKNAHI